MLKIFLKIFQNFESILSSQSNIKSQIIQINKYSRERISSEA
jgi:hypothetical protein